MIDDENLKLLSKSSQEIRFCYSKRAFACGHKKNEEFQIHWLKAFSFSRVGNSIKRGEYQSI